MRYHISFFTVLFVLVLSSYAIAQTPAESPEKPLYRPTGNEATLVGTISVEGPIPKPLRIDTTADPVCTQLNRKLETDWLLTNESRLYNAFIYVKSDVLDGHRFELPASEVTLQHINCMYAPKVLGLRVGQNLRIINADPTQHNTHPTPKLNREWNLSQAQGGEPVVKTFTREEVLIPFKDNQHPWEKAYVGVLNHPFFAVSDESGRFEIRGLPPGAYKLVVWHEKLGEQQLEVTLVPNESRNTDFTFAAAKKP